VNAASSAAGAARLERIRSQLAQALPDAAIHAVTVLATTALAPLNR